MKTNEQKQTDKYILTVKQFNEMQENNYKAYINKCKQNNVEPQPRNNFNLFTLCNYKSGFILTGQYWKHYRTKKEIYKALLIN